MRLKLNELLERVTRSYLRRIMKDVQGNVTLAAEIAGRNRTEFYRLLARHGLTAAEFRQ